MGCKKNNPALADSPICRFQGLFSQEDGLWPYNLILIFFCQVDPSRWITGWWLTYPSEKIWKSMGRIIPYIMEHKELFETTKQYMYDYGHGCYNWLWIYDTMDSMGLLQYLKLVKLGP